MERTERLEARLDSASKELLKRAALLRGRSLSDFVINAALRRAEEVIAGSNPWTLTAEQSRAFVERLMGDHEPSERLKQAFAEYRDSELARPR